MMWCLRGRKFNVGLKADATSANHFTPLHVTRYFSASSSWLHRLSSPYLPEIDLIQHPPCSHNMALRSPMSQLYKHASPSSIPKVAAISTRHATSKHTRCQMRSMATVVPPVTQDATSSKGPTAMVFMNMGGPSTTDEVGDFLSRLFVSSLDDC